MKALVTGGAGFIGSHIVERLLGEGHEVRVIDNLRSGHRENLGGFAGDIEFVEADIRDNDAMEHASKDCEIIFHQAAIVSVPYSLQHPQETHDVNIQGTLNVLKAAQERGVRRVVFASSAAVYGEDPRLPKTEEMLPEPLVPYAIEKITGEYYLSVFNQHFGVETVALRYFNVFGPRQDPRSPYSGVISIFVDRALSGGALTVFGDGEQYRDFVFVENVVDMNMLAATKENASGRVYNVGCGHGTSLNMLIEILQRNTGKKIEREYEAARAGDIRESLADISRAVEELGYEVKVEVEEGLGRLVNYERALRP